MLRAVVIKRFWNNILERVTHVKNEVEDVLDRCDYRVLTSGLTLGLVLALERFAVIEEHQILWNYFQHHKHALSFINQVTKAKRMDEIVLVENLVDYSENWSDIQNLEKPGAAKIPEGHQVVLQLVFCQLDFGLQVPCLFRIRLFIQLVKILFIGFKVPS